MASLPPFGPFLGKAVIDEAAAAVGLHCVTAVFVAVSAITGAAVLRAAGRIGLGWEPREEASEAAAGDEQEPETVGPRHRAPAAMVAGRAS